MLKTDPTMPADSGPAVRLLSPACSERSDGSTQGLRADTLGDGAIAVAAITTVLTDGQQPRYDRFEQPAAIARRA